MKYIKPMTIFGWDDAAGLLLGAGLQAFGGGMANRVSAAQAQNQIDWQNVWRSNAHQTEVADLKAAGLNPILSATGGSGAQVPAAAQAPQVNVMEGMASTAKDIIKIKKEMDILDSTNEKLKSEKEYIDTQNTLLEKTEPLAEIQNKALNWAVDKVKGAFRNSAKPSEIQRSGGIRIPVKTNTQKNHEQFLKDINLK